MGLDGFWGDEPRFLETVKIYEEALRKHNVPNSGMCLGGEWGKGKGKAFVVVAGDAFALLGDVGTIKGARENLGPLGGKAKKAVVVNGH